MISKSLEYDVYSSDIDPSIKSDHSLLKLSLLSNKEKKGGRGIWKLNVKLLTDKNYITLIQSVIAKMRFQILSA